LSDPAERDDLVGAWLSLPRRIYLDTSTLHKLYDFGGVIFEGEPFEPVGRAVRVQGLADEIDALRMIFMVNERAMFEFVVTEASLREVFNRTHLLAATLFAHDPATLRVDVLARLGDDGVVGRPVGHVRAETVRLGGRRRGGRGARRWRGGARLGRRGGVSGRRLRGW
jgi:hypothetical protein